MAVKVNSMLQCAMCQETYKKPKVLPCLHTFCLECLKTINTHEVDGDPLPCPLCRRQFIIPRGGLDQLPTNIFAEEMIKFRSLLASHVIAPKDTCKKSVPSVRKRKA